VQGALHIQSNEPVHPGLDVALSGRGIVPQVMTVTVDSDPVASFPLVAPRTLRLLVHARDAADGHELAATITLNNPLDGLAYSLSEGVLGPAIAIGSAIDEAAVLTIDAAGYTSVTFVVAAALVKDKEDKDGKEGGKEHKEGAKDHKDDRDGDRDLPPPPPGTAESMALLEQRVARLEALLGQHDRTFITPAERPHVGPAPGDGRTPR
jgi:hypothetical protein